MTMTRNCYDVTMKQSIPIATALDNVTHPYKPSPLPADTGDEAGSFDGECDYMPHDSAQSSDEGWEEKFKPTTLGPLELQEAVLAAVTEFHDAEADHPTVDALKRFVLLAQGENRNPTTLLLHTLCDLEDSGLVGLDAGRVVLHPPRSGSSRAGHSDPLGVDTSLRENLWQVVQGLEDYPSLPGSFTGMSSVHREAVMQEAEAMCRKGTCMPVVKDLVSRRTVRKLQLQYDLTELEVFAVVQVLVRYNDPKYRECMSDDQPETYVGDQRQHAGSEVTHGTRATGDTGQGREFRARARGTVRSEASAHVEEGGEQQHTVRVQNHHWRVSGNASAACKVSGGRGVNSTTDEPSGRGDSAPQGDSKSRVRSAGSGAGKPASLDGGQAGPSRGLGPAPQDHCEPTGGGSRQVQGQREDTSEQRGGQSHHIHDGSRRASAGGSNGDERGGGRRKMGRGASNEGSGDGVDALCKKARHDGGCDEGRAVGMEARHPDSHGGWNGMGGVHRRGTAVHGDSGRQGGDSGPGDSEHGEEGVHEPRYTGRLHTGNATPTRLGRVDGKEVRCTNECDNRAFHLGRLHVRDDMPGDEQGQRWGGVLCRDGAASRGTKGGGCDHPQHQGVAEQEGSRQVCSREPQVDRPEPRLGLHVCPRDRPGDARVCVWVAAPESLPAVHGHDTRGVEPTTKRGVVRGVQAGCQARESISPSQGGRQEQGGCAGGIHSEGAAKQDPRADGSAHRRENALSMESRQRGDRDGEAEAEGTSKSSRKRQGAHAGVQLRTRSAKKRAQSEDIRRFNQGADCQVLIDPTPFLVYPHTSAGLPDGALNGSSSPLYPNCSSTINMGTSHLQHVEGDEGPLRHVPCHGAPLHNPLHVQYDMSSSHSPEPYPEQVCNESTTIADPTGTQPSSEALDTYSTGGPTAQQRTAGRAQRRGRGRPTTTRRRSELRGQGSTPKQHRRATRAGCKRKQTERAHDTARHGTKKRRTQKGPSETEVQGGSGGEETRQQCEIGNV